MRAVITSYGTAGCTQPVLALAVELARHGHRTVVALPAAEAKRASQLGLEFAPLGPATSEARDAGSIASLTSHPERFDDFEYLYALGQEMARSLPLVFNQLREACRNADVLISKVTQPVARMIHELTGIPFAAFHTFYLPGTDTPLGHEGNEAYRKVTEAIVNPFRESLGLPSLKDPLTRNGDSAQLTLFAISPHVAPQPEGWPEHYHMPGYFFLDHETWEPDRHLDRFINAGERPVVISFGSMRHAKPDAVTDMLVKAIDLVGCRAVIQRGGSGLGKRKLPPHIHAVDSVPHTWLFPRASCVVHHGGSGTTAATLLAGAPSVFVPHTYDQPIWAQIVRDLGCTGPPLAFSEMTAERLAYLIAATISNPGYQQAARSLAVKIRGESGVQRSRELIENLLTSRA